MKLKKKAQEEFLKNIPMPYLSIRDKDLLNKIQFGNKEEKITSAKKINSEARTKTRKWNNYLSHPTTITIFLEVCDKEEDEKILEELIRALVFICCRHLPDLRTLPYFLKALKHKKANIRLLGLWGLSKLTYYPIESILELENDKSEKVRDEVSSLKARGYRTEFPSWMFQTTHLKNTP